jgi:hypothetical protein
MTQCFTLNIGATQNRFLVKSFIWTVSYDAHASDALKRGDAAAAAAAAAAHSARFAKRYA